MSPEGQARVVLEGLFSGSEESWSGDKDPKNKAGTLQVEKAPL